jgi:hypothetical protein
VANRHHQHNEPVIFDLRNDPVVADAITSKTLPVAGQRLPQPAGIAAAGNARAQKAKHAALGLGAKLSQIARGSAVELDTPAGRRHPRRPSALAAFGEIVLKTVERYARPAAPRAAARQIIILDILDLAQDGLARIIALAAASLPGKRIEALVDVGRKAKGKHGGGLRVAIHV